MNLGTSEDPRIGPVSPRQRADTLRLVFSRLPEEDRRRQLETYLAATSDAGLSSSELLGAHRRGRLVGAVFSQIQPGRTATLWPPRIVSDESAATAAKLLETACDRLARRDVCMAQVLLETESPPDVATLLEGGFERLAKLLYLVSPEVEFPNHPPPGPLVFQEHSAANHRRLAGVVEATYDQTLDCPRLNGVRRIEDVRSAAVVDRSARQSGRGLPVACRSSGRWEL